MDFFKSKKEIVVTKEYEKLLEFIKLYSGFFVSDRYIAKSEYKDLLAKYEDTINFFNVLNNSGLLKDYCKKNGYDNREIIESIDIYYRFGDCIDVHNKKYVKDKLVSEKDYLDNILKDVDPNILLDNNQREVVLTDEDYCLVIAGAGAGKTTTVAAKAKYLVEKMGIPSNEILIVSFTNKAVEELRERIIKDLKLNCLISTFHSIGNAILRNQSGEPFNISREGTLYYILLDYFKKSILTNESLTRKLVLFFSTYFDIPYDGDDLAEYLNNLSKANYSTLKSDINEFKEEIIDARTKKRITISNEIVRSIQEVQIANYLFLNNLDYQYEPVYEYNIRMANKPYTPDFVIKQGDNVVYLEHFGITQDGENSLYNKKDLEKYKKAVNDKIILHREHNTKLIYTFSNYNDGRTLLEHLDEELRKCGLILKRRDDKEVLQKIIDTEETKYISKLIVLISKFINLFKTNGYKEDKFDEFKNSTNNVRNHLFLDICKECYLEYERCLKEKRAIDFQDMINNSAIILQQMADKKEKLHFKYVIVDEYQDISRQRFDLVEALHKVCDAKIVAVGDDWQSIYAFSGSNIELFLEFEKKMGYAKMLKIENTYRNSQEVIDIAGSFIQKNDYQIKKTLKSPKHIDDPIIIYTYDSSFKGVNKDNKSGSNYNMALMVDKCIEDIDQYNKKEHKNDKKILMLGRYNFDENALEKSGLFQVMNKQGKIRSNKHPEFDITFMTAHASKGLGFDNVIIINCKNETFGFPSKIQSDPVMKHVLVEDKTYDFAEERRLFYVAMTRTKNRVFCVAPHKYPSEFLIEINKDYDKVVKNGEWEEEILPNRFGKKCPICGYPLQYKYKPAYGLRLYICTNEPEICSFMTNELKARNMQIMKCDQCQDGYLVVKPSKDDYILGCTNYKEDGTGCNNVVRRTKYNEIVGFTPDKPIEATNKAHKKKSEEKAVKLEFEKVNVLKNVFELDNGTDFYDVSRLILSCISNTSKINYFGISKTIDLLFGKKLDNSRYDVLQEMPEFGSLKGCKRIDIESIMDSLIANKLVIKTKEKYPVLHITNEGINYLSSYNKETIKKVHKKYKELKKVREEKVG